ncbi:GNAT family N-acetyltransferase [Geothrix sp. PMB-07]|uniref:GNAT family N-acetyltransferase n=1 Tax=Geothrix sp. PMB-07 TaxID=3068640 RepID=UPI0027409164|nr:GNAT family N-acetyltransferase [Geothrix sp. PMB-07]WLT32334.1 GNAT family N-acetyltransferase [Geothrix sp. PMB-07]
MLIRNFQIGDEPALRSIFFSSVHELTGGQYTPEQQSAWAPFDYDRAEWAKRIQAIHPFIAEIDGYAVGYADLQHSGYIDHFYVSGLFARRGVGQALMNHIHSKAASLQINELHSKVSLTAEPFFNRYGFHVENRHEIIVRGVKMSNASMRKSLLA